MTDANEITHALRLWFQAGDVFEVRVLDAVSADYRREHIESGSITSTSPPSRRR